MHAEDVDVLRRYTVREARERFKDLVDGVAYTRKPAIVTKHGTEKVAVIPYDLLEALMGLEAREDLEKARRSLDEFEKSGGMCVDDFKKQLIES